MKNKDNYIAKRDKYFPGNPSLIFIAESPPVSGKYFYDDETQGVSESLFAAMMKYVLDDYIPKSKVDGLQKFEDMGYFLLDCVYTPINNMSDSQRNNVILDNLEELYKDLRLYNASKSIPIILIKKNVCNLLECRLLRKGYNVLNNCQMIPFPASGNQSKFGNIVKKLLSKM